MENVTYQQTKLTTYVKVCKYLSQLNIKFQTLQHQQVRTSQEAAQIRKTPLEWGSKTLLISAQKTPNKIILLVYRAHLSLNWKKIRKIPFIGKKFKTLSDQEVQNLGVQPGGVPPFYEVLLNKQNIISVLDSKFSEIQNMAFNAGLKNKSILMKTKQYEWKGVQIYDIADNKQQKQQKY